GPRALRQLLDGRFQPRVCHFSGRRLPPIFHLGHRGPSAPEASPERSQGSSGLASLGADERTAPHWPDAGGGRESDLLTLRARSVLRPLSAPSCPYLSEGGCQLGCGVAAYPHVVGGGVEDPVARGGAPVAPVLGSECELDLLGG